MIKTLLSALLLASVATPSLALTAEDKRHNRLINQLNTAGVNVVINHPEACSSGYFGWYSGPIKVIAVCQSGMRNYDGSQKQFSSEDYEISEKSN